MTDQPPPSAGDPTDPGPPGGYGTPGGYTPGEYSAAPDGDYTAYGATTETLPAKGRGKRGVAIGVGAAVLVALGGAGIWAATQLSGGGRQPDDLVPKTTFAYAKVDLDPAMNQKLAAREFFAKFPKLKDDAGNADSVFEDVLAGLFDSQELDFERDVKPWFDKRAAVAAFPGSDGRPHVVAVLRSKDDDQARAALDKAVAKARTEGEEVAYRLTRGYAVVGQPAGVDQAVRLSEDESLEDNAVYTEDVDKLEGDQVVVGWTDIGAAFDAYKGEIPNVGLLPNAVTDQIKGRVVAGLHLTNDYAEVQGFSIGAGSTAPQVTASTEVLKSLPADTAAALSVNGIATGATQAGGMFDLNALLGQYLQGSGLSFENDILPALGDETVVSTGGFVSLMAPNVALTSKVTEPERAEAAGAKIAALLSFFGVEVKADAVGDRFVIGTPGTYVDQLTRGNGGLGASPRFTKAMGDLTGVAAALYVNLGAANTPFGDISAQGPDAAGVVFGQRGSEGFFRLRIVAE